MSKPFLICANWKLNKDIDEASEFCIDLVGYHQMFGNNKIVIFPGAYSLFMLSQFIDESMVLLGVQSFSEHESGAYTGETSLNQVQESIQYALIGHSERRNIFYETNEIVRKKISLMRNYTDITPILCIGESENTREDGQTKDFLTNQLESALQNHIPENLVVAYEPCWAISDGITPKTPPTADEIEETHRIIRDVLIALDPENGGDIPLLYGGSVSHKNIKDIYGISNVDGVLIGGASLKLDSLKDIIDECQ